MARNRFFLGTAIVIATVAMTSSTANAQAYDCGLECHICGTSAWEGTMYQEDGPYNMTCFTTEGGCEECPSAGSVNEMFVNAMSIADVVQGASVSELNAVVEAYGDRLLLHSGRGLLVVQGTPCNPQSFEAIVSLPFEKVNAFQRLGVTSLKAFLERESGT